MTGKQNANAAEKNEHHVRCPNICRNEMIFVERLGALIIHSSSKQEYTVRAAPQILCSLNLYTLWLFFIYQNRSRSDSLTWFNSVCLEIIVTVGAEICFDDFD